MLCTPRVSAASLGMLHQVWSVSSNGEFGQNTGAEDLWVLCCSMPVMGGQWLFKSRAVPDFCTPWELCQMWLQDFLPCWLSVFISSEHRRCHSWGVSAPVLCQHRHSGVQTHRNKVLAFHWIPQSISCLSQQIFPFCGCAFIFARVESKCSNYLVTP